MCACRLAKADRWHHRGPNHAWDRASASGARSVGGHDLATTPPLLQGCESFAGGAAEHASPGAQAAEYSANHAWDDASVSGKAFGEHHESPDRTARSVGGHDHATMPPPLQACESVASGAAEHASPGAQAAEYAPPGVQAAEPVAASSQVPMMPAPMTPPEAFIQAQNGSRLLVFFCFAYWQKFIVVCFQAKSLSSVAPPVPSPPSRGTSPTSSSCDHEEIQRGLLEVMAFPAY